MKNIEININLQLLAYDELTADDRRLVDKAKEATFRSYSPYSKFSVGAAVRLENGEEIVGCNQENAAYSLTICAERTALFASQAQYPNTAVTALAVAARNAEGEFLPQPCPPCGSCRQAILEHECKSGRPIRLLMVGEEGILVANTVKDILPLSFTEADMM